MVGFMQCFLFVYDILLICDSLFVNIAGYININPIDMQQLLHMYYYYRYYSNPLGACARAMVVVLCVCLLPS